MSSPLAAAKRAQADALRAQAAGLDLEAAALERHAPEADPILTLDEAEEFSKRPRRAIRDAIRDNKLDGYGRRPVTVRRSDLLAWVEASKVRPRATSSDADLAYAQIAGAS